MIFSTKKREQSKVQNISKNRNLGFLFIIIVILGIILMLFTSCAATQLTDSWKNPEFSDFNPQNVMVIGVTQNTTARMLYEQQLKDEFDRRGIRASQSGLIFEDSFKDSKQTEEDIEKQVQNLLELGYDTVVISAVKGIDEKTSYSDGMPNTYMYLRRFGRHYYLYQGIYFEPGYYNNYKIYHIETSVYDLEPEGNKQLVWVGSYDLVNPYDISNSVNRYVRIITKALEDENLIPLNRK